MINAKRNSFELLTCPLRANCRPYANPPLELLTVSNLTLNCLIRLPWAFQLSLSIFF